MITLRLIRIKRRRYENSTPIRSDMLELALNPGSRTVGLFTNQIGTNDWKHQQILHFELENVIARCQSIDKRYFELLFKKVLKNYVTACVSRPMVNPTPCGVISALRINVSCTTLPSSYTVTQESQEISAIHRAEAGNND